METLQSKQIDRSEVRSDLVNHLVAKTAEDFEKTAARPAEMGMIALVLLQVMLQYCKDSNIAHPRSMETQTPNGYTIKYTIEKTAAPLPGAIN